MVYNRDHVFEAFPLFRPSGTITTPPASCKGELPHGGEKEKSVFLKSLPVIPIGLGRLQQSKTVERRAGREITATLPPCTSLCPSAASHNSLLFLPSSTMSSILRMSRATRGVSPFASTSRSYKVAVLGAAGGIGQVRARAAALRGSTCRCHLCRARAAELSTAVVI